MSAAPRVPSLPLGLSTMAMWDDWGSLLGCSWACADLETLSSCIVLGQPRTSGGWEPGDQSFSHGLGVEVHSTWLHSAEPHLSKALLSSVVHPWVGLRSSQSLHFCFLRSLSKINYLHTDPVSGSPSWRNPSQDNVLPTSFISTLPLRTNSNVPCSL